MTFDNSVSSLLLLMRSEFSFDFNCSSLLNVMLIVSVRQERGVWTNCSTFASELYLGLWTNQDTVEKHNAWTFDCIYMASCTSLIVTTKPCKNNGGVPQAWSWWKTQNSVSPRDLLLLIPVQDRSNGRVCWPLKKDFDLSESLVDCSKQLPFFAALRGTWSKNEWARPAWSPGNGRGRPRTSKRSDRATASRVSRCKWTKRKNIWTSSWRDLPNCIWLLFCT